MKRLIFVTAKLLNLLETILNIYVKNALIPETSRKDSIQNGFID